MKQTLLFCFIALFLSFSVFSQENYPGQVCSTAIPIASLPYVTTDTTANYGDEYTGSAGSSCDSGNPYMNGDDVFYTFTASSNVPVTITMNPTNIWSGLFVYNSCANVGVSCITGVANSSTNPREIVLPVTVGQTYIIAISTWATSPATQSTDYTLTIVENSCTNFTANYLIQPDCANGEQFFAVVNITNMGSASSITVTSSQGENPQIATVTGAVLFGPYPNGTEVVLNAQNSNNPNCFSTSPSLTQVFCPATNNLCSNAIPIVCGSNITQTTVGATTVGAPSFTCGTTPGAGGLWYTYEGTGDLVTMSLCNSLYDTKIQVVTGSCGLFTCVTGNNNFCGNSSQVTFISVLGTTYYVYVYGLGSSQGIFTLNVNCEAPPTPPTNDACENATLINVNTNSECAFTTSGTINGATPSPQTNTCAGTPNNDVWFQFVATYEEHVIKLSNIIGSGTILNHTVFSSTNAANPCNNLTVIYCSGLNISYTNNYVIGQTYYIRVYSIDASVHNTTFDICITTPNTPIAVSTTQYTVPELIQNVLTNGECTTTSNITWSTGINFNSVNGIGYFNRNGSDFPFAEGIILSSGNVENIPGFNLTALGEGNNDWVGDNDLNAIILAATGQPMNSRNATKIEFDFVPQNNFISFDFIFASEEYGTFQCSFADAFAFLLTDVATGITTNLAVVPGTQLPVSVVTIRDVAFNSECASVNPDYFADFYGPLGQSNYSAAVNFNGKTHPMTASSAVIPNNLYKIKLVVADRQDNILDSAVFLEGGSFALGNQCQNVIQLEAFIDSNDNGVKDAGENPYTLGTFNYNVNDAPEMNVTYSPSGVAYIVVDNTTDSYDFTYQIYPEVAAYFNTATSHPNITFNAIGNNVYYFPIAVTQPYNDVEVNLTATFGPNPGFPYSNTISYKNNGVTPASGTLTYMKDPVLTITSVSQAGTVATANGFTYNFTNLAPNETRTIQVGLLTPTIPTVSLGDQLTNSVSSTTANDFNTNNNSASLLQIVSGSYDPNDKLEAHGPEIQISTFGADDYLYYTIRFQNTGTANAETVIITDFLDGQLDESSIRMISASHAYTLNRIGSDLTWTFAAINLVPELVSSQDSQGHVHFKIKPKAGYAVGDVIPNTAQIYFDFNEPIITNTCTTEFVTTLGVDDLTAAHFMMYPNPANDRVTIAVNNATATIATVRLINVLGQVVHQQKGTPNQTVIDISGLTTGLYVVEIVTESEITIVKKLIKE